LGTKRVAKVVGESASKPGAVDKALGIGDKIQKFHRAAYGAGLRSGLKGERGPSRFSRGAYSGMFEGPETVYAYGKGQEIGRKFTPGEVAKLQKGVNAEYEALMKSLDGKGEEGKILKDLIERSSAPMRVDGFAHAPTTGGQTTDVLLGDAEVQLRKLLEFDRSPTLNAGKKLLEFERSPTLKALNRAKNLMKKQSSDDELILALVRAHAEGRLFQS